MFLDLSYKKSYPYGTYGIYKGQQTCGLHAGINFLYEGSLSLLEII